MKKIKTIAKKLFGAKWKSQFRLTPVGGKM